MRLLEQPCKLMRDRSKHNSTELKNVRVYKTMLTKHTRIIRR